MILIADSGSTKTTWCVIDHSSGEKTIFSTQGINPLYQDEESIYGLLEHEFNQVLPGQLTIYFYGAGCINNSVNEPVKNALKRYFNTDVITVDTDLTAAARALCQHHEGIACILGTGSNSCYYNGKEIVKNVSPLGYMLGDEGSGAVIGRKFIGDLLKNQLPEKVRKDFYDRYQLTDHQIMEHVYKKPFPNRFLARFMHFILDNRHEQKIHQLILNSFVEFFQRNVAQYPEAEKLPVHFTGSVAFHFSEELEEAARLTGFSVGTISEEPVEGLIQYHYDMLK